MNQTISVAHDFSRFPAGRFREDGPFPGAKFRDDYLLPALEKAKSSGGHVVVDLDGTLGGGSSFLEECFGGLVRLHNFTYKDLKKLMTIKYKNDFIVFTIWKFIEDAKPKANNHGI